MMPHCAKYIYGGYASLIRRSTVFYNLHYKSSENRPMVQKPDLTGYVRINQLIREKQPGFNYFRAGLRFESRIVL